MHAHEDVDYLELLLSDHKFKHILSLHSIRFQRHRQPQNGYSMYKFETARLILVHLFCILITEVNFILKCISHVYIFEHVTSINH